MNKFMVGLQGENVVILGLNPPGLMGPRPIAVTKADALNLAAWLVALADTDALEILDEEGVGHEKEHRSERQPTAFQKALSEALS